MQDQKRYQEQQAEAIVGLLWEYLKRDPEHKDRRQTGFGTKTREGLVASVRRVVLDPYKPEVQA